MAAEICSRNDIFTSSIFLSCQFTVLIRVADEITETIVHWIFNFLIMSNFERFCFDALCWSRKWSNIFTAVLFNVFVPTDIKYQYQRRFWTNKPFLSITGFGSFWTNILNLKTATCLRLQLLNFLLRYINVVNVFNF